MVASDAPHSRVVAFSLLRNVSHLYGNRRTHASANRLLLRLAACPHRMFTIPPRTPFTQLHSTFSVAFSPTHPTLSYVPSPACPLPSPRTPPMISGSTSSYALCHHGFYYCTKNIINQHQYQNHPTQLTRLQTIAFTHIVCIIPIPHRIDTTTTTIISHMVGPNDHGTGVNVLN